MLAQRVQRGKTPRLRFGRRRREEVERRHSGDQRRPGAAEREKGNRRDGNRGSALGRKIRRDAAEPGRKPEQRSSRAPLWADWGNRDDGTRGLAPVRKNRAQPTGTGAMRPMMRPWAGRRWRQRGRRFPGKHRSGEKIEREQPGAPNGPRDNASAAFGDYSP